MELEKLKEQFRPYLKLSIFGHCDTANKIELNIPIVQNQSGHYDYPQLAQIVLSIIIENILDRIENKRIHHIGNPIIAFDNLYYFTSDQSLYELNSDNSIYLLTLERTYYLKIDKPILDLEKVINGFEFSDNRLFLNI